MSAPQPDPAPLTTEERRLIEDLRQRPGVATLFGQVLVYLTEGERDWIVDALDAAEARKLTLESFAVYVAAKSCDRYFTPGGYSGGNQCGHCLSCRARKALAAPRPTEETTP